MIIDKTIDFQITCEAAPLQIEGNVNGKAFYFRARWDQWTFAISYDDKVHPAKILSSKDGFFFRCGDVGESGGYAASWMSVDEAMDIIARCIRSYNEEG